MGHTRRQAVEVVNTISGMRAKVASWRKAGARVGLVPTMGALHAGHLRLVQAAKQNADKVIVSIFVNPAQFGPTEDFSKYPRTLEDDCAKLAVTAADLVFAPNATEMYPPEFATRVVPAGAAFGLESDFRPHFFEGVATVCCKLFTASGADIACFGEKDFQQLAVVRQIARDLDLPIRIVGVPTERETDGLAMSSRNRFLSLDERKVAAKISRTLNETAKAIREIQDADQACAAAISQLTKLGFNVDYLVLRDAETLQLAETASDRPLRLLVAAWLGKTRLIDNIGV